MSNRSHISVKDKVTVAIAQASGGHIICPLCMKWLEAEDKRILEHLVCRAFTNSDDIKLLAWVHKACADLKTYGRKATCADGDIHKVRKAGRIARGGKTVRRPMKKHPTLKRSVGGKVVERRT